VELDWQPGEFFEDSGLYLVCSTHGAIFEPSTGLCVAGPCRGARLEAIAVEERDGLVQLVDDSPGLHAGSGPSP
jgi:nitrite reductase/ring-hydroxylating ferredoxin subunit